MNINFFFSTRDDGLYAREIFLSDETSLTNDSSSLGYRVSDIRVPTSKMYLYNSYTLVCTSLIMSFRYPTDTSLTSIPFPSSPVSSPESESRFLLRKPVPVFPKSRRAIFSFGCRTTLTSAGYSDSG